MIDSKISAIRLPKNRGTCGFIRTKSLQEQQHNHLTEYFKPGGTGSRQYLSTLNGIRRGAACVVRNRKDIFLSKTEIGSDTSHTGFQKQWQVQSWLIVCVLVLLR